MYLFYKFLIYILNFTYLHSKFLQSNTILHELYNDRDASKDHQPRRDERIECKEEENRRVIVAVVTSAGNNVVFIPFLRIEYVIRMSNELLDKHPYPDRSRDRLYQGT